MNQKSPTETIYQCLKVDFWTNKKCQNCQQIFTEKDYHYGNYYLTFWEVNIKPMKFFFQIKSTACLDEVVIYLFHHHCPLFKTNPLSECQTEELKDSTCKP